MADSLERRIEDKQIAKKLETRELLEDTYVEVCSLGRINIQHDEQIGKQDLRIREIESWQKTRSVIEKFLLGAVVVVGAVVTIVKIFF